MGKLDNKAIFAACISQCEWCVEQWPVVVYEKNIVHVAPFTKDPKLFYWSCDSSTIRRAFNYMEYKGGKKVSWTPPSEAAITLMNRLSGKGGIVKNVTSPKSRDFWRGTIRASLQVASWPLWKRSVDIDGKKPKEITPEELRRMRDELLSYDALDYWTRQPCTESLQYRPHLNKGRVEKPTCNHGIGCIGCWGRYEVFYNDLHKNACD
jgi:hypothetical protein